MVIDDDIRKKIDSINTLIDNKKYNLAKREVIKFLDRFPNSIDANLYYIDILRIEDKSDLAVEVCKKNLDNNKIKFRYAIVNRRLNNLQESLDAFIDLFEEKNSDKIIINIVIILIKQNRFEEAYKFLIKLSDNICDKNIFRVSILRRYIYTNIYPELKEILKHDRNISYHERQIINYNENYAKNYISAYKSPKYIFSSDTNLIEIFKKVKQLIKEQEYNDFDLYDKYIIHIPKIGMVNGVLTDYLMVGTNINTKNIVIMHPCIYYGENAIEYSQESNNQYEDIKTKRNELSRIEKFNKKYGFK